MKRITVSDYRISGRWVEENNLRLFDGNTDSGEEVLYRPSQLGLSEALIFKNRIKWLKKREPS
jgi:hypothetical protein